MSLENKYQLIDEYLSGSMGQDDIDKFKAFMQSDADLRAETMILGEMEEMSSFATMEEGLRDTLKGIRNEAVPQKSGINKFIKLGLAALLLGLLAYMVYPKLSTGANDDLLIQYASVEPLTLTTKSADLNMDLREMQDFYNAGNYSKALLPINNYLSAHPQDIDVLLAKGIALYQTGDYKAAQLTFDSINALQPRVAKHKWHSALAYIKAKDTAAAKVILEEIVLKESYNHEKAKQILANFQ